MRGRRCNEEGHPGNPQGRDEPHTIGSVRIHPAQRPGVDLCYYAPPSGRCMAHLTAHRRLAVRTPVAKTRGPARGSAALAGGLIGLGLLAVVVVLAWSGAQGAPAVPFSDESGHIITALGLKGRVALPPHLGPDHGKWIDLLRPTNSYPPLFHALVQPVLGRLPGLLPFRAVAAAFVALHAALALAVGPRLWGQPATWAYIALACGGPVLLTMSTLAFVDGPSAACTGIAILMLLRSDGFRRPAASMGFALAAVAAMYTKWTVLIFLGPPVAWEVARSVGLTARGLRARAGLALGLCALAGGLAAAVWVGGTHPALEAAMRDVRQPWSFRAPLLAGLGLVATVAAGALWPAPARRLLKPAVLAALALVGITLLAGPWYIGAHRDLLERLAHESSQLAMRQARPQVRLDRSLASLGEVVPLVSLALVPGLLSALRRPWALGQALASLVGGGLGTAVVLATLPPDLRYLLPAAPLLAAAAARGLGLAPTRLALPLALVVVVGQVGPSLPILRTDQPLTDAGREQPGGASVVRRLGPPWLPLPLGRVLVPSPLAATEVDRMVKTLWSVTEGGRHPVLVLEGNGQDVQSRALVALATLHRYGLRTLDGRWQTPMPAMAPDQWVLAPACEAEPVPAPIARFEGQWGWCDLGLYQGGAPAPKQQRPG